MISRVWLLMTGSFILLSNYFYWKITKTACLIKRNIFNSVIRHRLESFSPCNQKDKWSKKKKRHRNSHELKPHPALSSFHPQYMYFCHLCHLHSWRHHQISSSSFLCEKTQMFKKEFKGVLTSYCLDQAINIKIKDKNNSVSKSLKSAFGYK